MVLHYLRNAYLGVEPLLSENGISHFIPDVHYPCHFAVITGLVLGFFFITTHAPWETRR
jgi:hypothetical protein